MQAFGRNQIRVQVSVFSIWGLLTPGTLYETPPGRNSDRLNVEHRTPNIER
jgi:hypothetical protein